MIELIDHTSAATAYVVADYPHTREARTWLRCWVETSAYGQRFVAEVWNPDRERWRAPHVSRYAPVTALYLGAHGQIDHAQLRRGASEPAIEAFIARFPATCGVIRTAAVLLVLRAEARAQRRMAWSVGPGTRRQLRKAGAGLRQTFRGLVVLEFLKLTKQSHP